MIALALALLLVLLAEDASGQRKCCPEGQLLDVFNACASRNGDAEASKPFFLACPSAHRKEWLENQADLKAVRGEFCSDLALTSDGKVEGPFLQACGANLQEEEPGFVTKCCPRGRRLEGLRCVEDDRRGGR